MFCYKRSFCKPPAEFLVRRDSASSVPTLWSWGDRSCYMFSMKKIVLWNASSSEKNNVDLLAGRKYASISLQILHRLEDVGRCWKMLEDVGRCWKMSTMSILWVAQWVTWVCILLSLVSPDLDGSQVFRLLVLFCWISHHRFSTETEFVTMRLHLLRPLQLFLYFRNYMNIAWNLHDNSLRIFTVVLQLLSRPSQPASLCSLYSLYRPAGTSCSRKWPICRSGFRLSLGRPWKTWWRTRRPGLKIWRPSVLDSLIILNSFW